MSSLSRSVQNNPQVLPNTLRCPFNGGSMLVPVGKHKGKSAELLVLKEPGYVHWLQEQTATGPLHALQKEVQHLIKKYGAIAGKLQIFRSYTSALTHVEFYCASRQSDYKELVKAIAQAKGLPSRVGEPQAVAFFK